jgi:hypothetical protein
MTDRRLSRADHLCSGHDTPSTDDVVGVTSKQGLAVGGPGEGDTLGVARLLGGAGGGEVGLQLVDLGLLLQVEDDDGGRSGGAEPVSVGGEDKGVDLVVGVQRVEVLGLIKIPEHGGTVLTARGTQRSIGGNGDGVDVAGVADVVGLQLTGGELPDLVASVSERRFPHGSLIYDSERVGGSVQGDYLSHGPGALK